MRYRKYKGCFGLGPFESKKRMNFERVGKVLGLKCEDYAEPALTRRLNKVMNNPTYILDMRCVEKMSLRFGLILKVFYDEFKVIHGYVPSIYPPKSTKVKAILNHLGVASDTGLSVSDYNDITCWQIVDWEIIENKGL